MLGGDGARRDRARDWDLTARVTLVVAVGAGVLAAVMSPPWTPGICSSPRTSLLSASCCGGKALESARDINAPFTTAVAVALGGRVCRGIAPGGRRCRHTRFALAERAMRASCVPPGRWRVPSHAAISGYGPGVRLIAPGTLSQSQTRCRSARSRRCRYPRARYTGASAATATPPPSGASARRTYLSECEPIRLRPASRAQWRARTARTAAASSNPAAAGIAPRAIATTVRAPAAMFAATHAPRGAGAGTAARGESCASGRSRGRPGAPAGPGTSLRVRRERFAGGVLSEHGGPHPRRRGRRQSGAHWRTRNASCSGG